eukprot:c9297_g1_i1 orf=396-749(+)
MGTLGFEDYLEPLRVYLIKYREIEGERATMAKQGEQSMGKDVGAMSGSPAAMMGVNGVINGGGMPGQMQIMQPQGGYVYSPHQYVQAPYHQMQQPMQGGGGVGHPLEVEDKRMVRKV